MQDLLDSHSNNKKPLSHKLKPKKIDEFIGQNKVMGEDTILRKLIAKKNIVNSIFYGPPGTGKTSLAQVISRELNYSYDELNATNASVKDIKKIVENAEKRLKINGKQTILFLDEIHRFNKLQQDSLLPSTEQGIIVLIGATTQNPYYNLNNSLLSRCLVFKFEKLNKQEISKILLQGINYLDLDINREVVNYLAEISNGDSRKALNYLEVLSKIGIKLDITEVKSVLGSNKTSFDKEEDKYNVISALIKSIRGSDPNSAIYWLARLLEGGEDPEYISRRMVILASEDIGLANPDAIVLANSCMNGVSKIGMPEARILLSELVIYLAISTKSNSAYSAINEAMLDIGNGFIQEVPEHLKNNGNTEYKYPHNFSGNFVYQKYSDEQKKYYYPGKNKKENLISEKIKNVWGEIYE